MASNELVFRKSKAKDKGFVGMASMMNENTITTISSDAYGFDSLSGPDYNDKYGQPQRAMYVSAADVRM